MDKNTQSWREYYEKSLKRSHSPRTEAAIHHNSSGIKVAIDCGCGTGADIAYLAQQDYQVNGFDINPDSIAICQQRFANQPHVSISQSSFENYDYPDPGTIGIIIAHSSLFFAEPIKFQHTWASIAASLANGGVFAGDFMGTRDSWASVYRSSTTPLTREQVQHLFTEFEIIKFDERDEQGQTALGRIKHWHTFSVIAVKSS